jgi:flagellar hook assembly protein FlgD
VRAATDLAVYDASGRLVRRLVSQVLDAGAHAITWDGLDSAGRLTPSGVYLLELVQPGQLRAVQKATIVR